MGKIAVLLFLVFLTVLAFFAVENKDVVTVKVPFNSAYEMPKIALILLASSLGALVVLLVFFIRDTKRVIDNLQYQKRQKREARVREHYDRALNAMLGNKEEEARDALKGILKEDPENTNALLKLGDLALEYEDYPTALDFYRRVRDIHPGNLQALLSLETVMERVNKTGEALRHLDEILDKDGENLTALRRKRTILEKGEKWDDLLSLQKTVIKLEQHDREKQREERRLLGYKYEYARASIESGQPEKAEKAFRTLLKMDGAFVPAYLGMAEVMLAKNETEEAINFLEKGFEQLRSPILLARLEDLLISDGEPGRLIRFYKNAIMQNPQDSSLKFLLAKLYDRLEMVDDAIDTLATVDPAVFAAPELHSLKAELFAKRNQSARALEEYRKACGLSGTLLTRYCCTTCGSKSTEWSGRCPRCGDWGSYNLDLRAVC